MPCYNAMPFLSEALDSIINQTYTNLEILCVNDGSSDGTPDALEKYAKKDPRIRIIHNETNLKLIATLNKGVNLAQGEYIARMDADDIAFPERIEKQLNLCLSQKVDLVGSNIISISQSGEILNDKNRPLVNQHEIEFGSYFFTPFIHPTVMGRTKLFVENPYSTDKTALHAEDYELWTRIVSSNYKLYNLADSLLKFRDNQGSVSKKFKEEQIENFIFCANKHQGRFLEREIPIEITSVAVNRMTNFSTQTLRKGVKLINDITEKYLSEQIKDNKDVKNIRTIAAMQKLDVSLQSIKKGGIISKFFGIKLLLLILLTHLTNRKLKTYFYSKK